MRKLQSCGPLKKCSGSRMHVDAPRICNVQVAISRQHTLLAHCTKGLGSGMVTTQHAGGQIASKLSSS